MFLTFCPYFGHRLIKVNFFRFSFISTVDLNFVMQRLARVGSHIKVHKRMPQSAFSNFAFSSFLSLIYAAQDFDSSDVEVLMIFDSYNSEGDVLVWFTTAFREIRHIKWPLKPRPENRRTEISILNQVVCFCLQAEVIKPMYIILIHTPKYLHHMALCTYSGQSAYWIEHFHENISK